MCRKLNMNDIKINLLSDNEINLRLDELLGVDSSFITGDGGTLDDYCNDLNAVRDWEAKFVKPIDQLRYCSLIRRLLKSENIWDVVHASAGIKARALLIMFQANRCVYSEGGVCGFSHDIGEISDDYCNRCANKTRYVV